MADLKRLPDWEPRLDAYLASIRESPFSWAEHDCAWFVAGAIDAMCGSTLKATLLALYADKDEASELVTKEGFANVVTRFLGEPVGRFMGRRGDAVLYVRHDDTEWQFGLAVHDGQGLLTPGAQLTRLPMDLAVRVWRVG